MNVFRRTGIDVGGRWLSVNIQVIRFLIGLPRFLYCACCFEIVDGKAAYTQDHRSHAHVRRRTLTDMPTFWTLGHGRTNLTFAPDPLKHFIELIT
ncbi:MAG: hypothetical protein JO108_29825 [Acidobacteriaceae bacterium]|nr:hypothetical protein [Acidobacteriaceae bacterium]